MLEIRVTIDPLPEAERRRRLRQLSSLLFGPPKKEKDAPPGKDDAPDSPAKQEGERFDSNTE